MIMLTLFALEYLLRGSHRSTLVQSRQARRDDDDDEDVDDNGYDGDEDDEDDADDGDDDDNDIVPDTLVLSRQARRGGRVHLGGDSTCDHR